MKIGRVISIAGNAIPLPEAGFRLMFPRRCSASMKDRKSRVQLKLMICKQISIMEFLNLRNT